MVGGFGGVGSPPTLIQGILDCEIKDLTVIANDAGFPHIGVGRLITAGRVTRLIASHIGSNPVAGELMIDKQLQVEFSPQGTLAERIRAGGIGIPGFLTDIGIGTIAQDGKAWVQLNDTEYLLETALESEVSIVYAKRADHFGNLVYDKTAQNFNPLVAMAGRLTIAEADEIVPTGSLEPTYVATPGVFVDYVVQSEGVKWRWPWESMTK